MRLRRQAAVLVATAITALAVGLIPAGPALASETNLASNTATPGKTIVLGQEVGYALTLVDDNKFTIELSTGPKADGCTLTITKVTVTKNDANKTEIMGAGTVSADGRTATVVAPGGEVVTVTFEVKVECPGVAAKNLTFKFGFGSPGIFYLLQAQNTGDGSDVHAQLT